MRADYKRWLIEQRYSDRTVGGQLSQSARVEEYYGNLDELYAVDRLEGLLEELKYSTDDSRRLRANPSRIPISGDIRSNLASYRSSVALYRKFLERGIVEGDLGRPEAVVATTATLPASSTVQRVLEDLGERVGLERDMQAALRKNLEQLEVGLVAIDDGAERSVDSGFIDITARDASGAIVVIELKTGTAGQRAIAQILSYMGDIAQEEGAAVRGILVASDFDGKARSAARVTPTLSLRRYGIKFQFTDAVD